MHKKRDEAIVRERSELLIIRDHVIRCLSDDNQLNVVAQSVALHHGRCLGIEGHEGRSLAREIAGLIIQGIEDPRVEHLPKGQTRILLKHIIPTAGPKQTQEGRRKRLNKALLECLEEAGWRFRGSNVPSLIPRAMDIADRE